MLGNSTRLAATAAVAPRSTATTKQARRSGACRAARNAADRVATAPSTTNRASAPSQLGNTKIPNPPIPAPQRSQKYNLGMDDAYLATIMQTVSPEATKGP